MLSLLCQVDSSTSMLWIGSFTIKGVTGYLLLLPCFTEIFVCNANSEDPDKTPCSAASDLGLHCFPMSFLWDGRHKLVTKARSFQCYRWWRLPVWFPAHKSLFEEWSTLKGKNLLPWSK